MSLPTPAQPTPSHLKFTCEDYLSFPDDGNRHEIIDGDHFMTPAPLTRHQRISGILFGFLFACVDAHHSGEVLAAPTDVVLSRFDVVQPDMLYVSEARRDIIKRENIQGAPDLVIEIISEGTRKTDEVIKRRLYERSGIPEYWTVDPEVETVKVYRLQDGKYRRIELTLEAPDQLTTPLLPEFSLPLERLFAL